MGKLVLLSAFTLLSTPAQACLTSEMYTYYFFSEVQEEFSKSEFIARIRLVNFTPGEYNNVCWTDQTGVTHTRRDPVSWQSVTYEILEVLAGSTDERVVTQQLWQHSCSQFFATDRDDNEFIVADHIKNGKPLIQDFQAGNGGLY